MTQMMPDAIVNTANSQRVIGTKLAYAIHEKAGQGLLEARKQIGAIRCGYGTFYAALEAGLLTLSGMMAALLCSAHWA